MTDIAIRRIELSQHIYVRVSGGILQIICLYQCDEPNMLITEIPSGSQLLEIVEIAAAHTAKYH